MYSDEEKRVLFTYYGDSFYSTKRQQWSIFQTSGSLPTKGIKAWDNVGLVTITNLYFSVNVFSSKVNLKPRGTILGLPHDLSRLPLSVYRCVSPSSPPSTFFRGPRNLLSACPLLEKEECHHEGADLREVRVPCGGGHEPLQSLSLPGHLAPQRPSAAAQREGLCR